LISVKAIFAISKVSPVSLSVINPLTEAVSCAVTNENGIRISMMNSSTSCFTYVNNRLLVSQYFTRTSTYKVISKY